ncbi:MAG TPA: class I SAM-dependent methyltransferase [Roseiflexaceae bacterium]|nr:class I SAM-dependent methyltransferase [Roseiflexaceae bacterium]
MDLDTLHWLRLPDGQALLDELAQHDIRDATLLNELQRLRARYTPEQARAAVEQTMLRMRARVKFSHADVMFFTREALEQATAEPVARHRAGRIASHGMASVVDLGCGIGGDALALAAAGLRVTAIDRDPLRVALAQANAEALGLAERMTFVHADVVDAPPHADALFVDPARRSGGRRVFDVGQYQPPLDRVFAWGAQTPALCVKLAPGVPYEELAPPFAHEIECVSLHGELKETTLWCGPFAAVSHRATVLPSGANLATTPNMPGAPLAEPAAFLYEPDPAVIRAHLVAELAHELDAAQLDAQIAYLTSDQQIVTPFARAWRVLEWQPWQLKRLRARLRALDAGSVTVKKRGSPLDTDALARQLSGKGSRPLVVTLTRLQEQPIAIICEQIA